jgi:hypothetical protein
LTNCKNYKKWKLLFERDYSIGSDVQSKNYKAYFIECYSLKIEEFDCNKINLCKEGAFYFAKKVDKREHSNLLSWHDYTNVRSGDLSKFGLIQVKIKMIDNQQTGNISPLLCGIQKLKSYKKEEFNYYSTEGIYFIHRPDQHICGCSFNNLKTNLKFDSNGECLVIKVDRTNDLLSFIDDYNNIWSINLSKVIGNDPFVFCLEMHITDVKFQFQFFTKTPKPFPTHFKDINDSSFCSLF